jgi:hypothetical protein
MPRRHFRADTVGARSGRDARPAIAASSRWRRSPSDRTVRDICAALRINEAWLRTGEGPMEIETPDTLAAMLAEQYGLSPYAARVIKALAHAAAELSEDQFARLAGIVIAEMKKGAPAEDEHIPAERAEALSETVSPDRADRNEAE